MARQRVIAPGDLVRVAGHKGVWKVVCGNRAQFCRGTGRSLARLQHYGAGLHLTALSAMPRVDLRDVDPARVARVAGILG